MSTVDSPSPNTVRSDELDSIEFLADGSVQKAIAENSGQVVSFDCWFDLWCRTVLPLWLQDVERGGWSGVVLWLLRSEKKKKKEKEKEEGEEEEEVKMISIGWKSGEKKPIVVSFMLRWIREIESELMIAVYVLWIELNGDVDCTWWKVLVLVIIGWWIVANSIEVEWLMEFSGSVSKWTDQIKLMENQMI